jgi:hypothetical protein
MSNPSDLNDDDLEWPDLSGWSERAVIQPTAESTEPSGATEASNSTPVDEQALAALLTEYVTGPPPGPVMGTFDGIPIELTDENVVYMSETATAAGRGLTVKGKRRQHYMTFSPPHPGTTTVWIASTPPETPPRGPSPVQAAAVTTAAPVRSDGPVGTPPARAAEHVGSGIRKRPYKCRYCVSTFSSSNRRSQHIERFHAERLVSSATSSDEMPLTEDELFN